MSYLRLTRGRLILGSFAASSILLFAFPAIDLHVSRLFFDGGFHLSDEWWAKFLHDGMVWFLGASMAFVVALYACNRLSKRNWCGVDGKRVLYLFIVLALGAGVIVNVLLKDNFGRARPRDIAEFGGTKVFTPAFVISRECHKNCSFSSGEGAGGFFALALALALNRRRATLAAAFAVGCVVSYWRVASGAHFLSDALVSFFVMLIVADVLFYYVVQRDPEPGPAPRKWRAGLEPQPATQLSSRARSGTS
jgi:lipid A 4'-phosphatase